MLKAIVEDFGNGGTLDGDVTITGDLTVSGGGSLSFDEILEGTQVIDVTSTEAFLVRKNSDGGDVFTVDTTNEDVAIGGTRISSEGTTKRLKFHGSGDNYVLTGCYDDNGWGYLNSYNNASGMQFYTGAGSFYFSNGSVGIGVAAPLGTLDIAGTDTTSNLYLSRIDSSISDGNGIGGIINFYGTGGANHAGATISAVAAENWSSGNAGTDLHFSTTPKTTETLTTRMVIDDAGSVGIGRAPTSNLDLYSASSGQPKLILHNANTGASQSAVLAFEQGSTSQADDQLLGYISFSGLRDNDSGQETMVAFETKMSDITTADSAGELGIKVNVDNTLVNLLNINGYTGVLGQGEVCVNEAGLDIDFRVESNDSANMLFVDGGTNKVGIGTAAPICPLTVDGAYGIYVRHTSNPLVAFDDTNVADASSPITFIDGDGGSLAFGRANRNSGTGLRTSSTNTMTLDSSGNVVAGHSTAQVANSFTSKVQSIGTDASGGFTAARFSANDGSAKLNFAKSRHASAGSHTVVADNDTLGDINFTASDGTDFGTLPVRIRAEVDDSSPTSSSIGGALTFATAAGASSDDIAERMRIDKSGNVGIGATAPISPLTISAPSLNPIGSLTSQAQYALVIQGSDTNTSGRGIAFGGDGDTDVGASIIAIDTASAAVGDLAFYTKGESDSTAERMRIHSSGNVSGNGGLAFYADTNLSGSVSGILSLVESGESSLSSSNNQSVYLKTYDSSEHKLLLTSSGLVGIGDDANANMTIGLTINQGGADNEIFSCKSSDVAHGVTDVAETDTYFKIQKQGSGDGGAQLVGFSEAGRGLVINGIVGAEDDSRNTSAYGNIHLNAYLINSATTQAHTSDENIMVITNGGTSRFVFDSDGNLHADASFSATAWDDYDDAQLLRTYDLSHGKGIIESKFDEFIDYNHEKLAELKLVGREEDGTPNHFINVTGMQRLHNGAIWQQYTELQKMKELMYDTMVEMLGKEKADDKLKDHDIKLLDENTLLN